MIRSLRDKFVYVRVPKTASSSVRQAVTAHHACRVFAIRMRADAYPRAISAEQWRDAYVFACVRNPWARMVSHWAYVKRYHERKGRKDLIQPFDEHCRRYLVEQHQLDWLVAGGRMVCDAVGRMEDMERAFRYFCQRASLPSGLSLPHLNRSRHGAYQDYYTDDLAELVGRVYREFNSIFGYGFEGGYTGESVLRFEKDATCIAHNPLPSKAQSPKYDHRNWGRLILLRPPYTRATAGAIIASLAESRLLSLRGLATATSWIRKRTKYPARRRA